MKKILYVTKFTPENRPFGGLTRTRKHVEALRRRFDVRVVGFQEDEEPLPRGRVSTAATALLTHRPYQTLRYDTPWLRKELAHQLETFQPDAVHVDYLNQAPLVWDLSLPLALDLHNVESAFAAAIGRTSPGLTGLMARRDGRLLRKVEETAAERFRLITVPNEKEAGRMPGNVHVVLNAVDETIEIPPVTVEPGLLCFVGIFSWAPNIDGAEWMVRKVLPLLPPSVRLELVGRNPHKRVLDLAGPRVTVTGEVPDVWPHVARASVVLAPLLAPGGTRFKILEGLMAGRPVVSTPAAADGLEDLEGSGLVLGEEPAAFAAAVTRLLDDPELAAKLGRTGREAVLDRYTWSASQQRLLDLYDEHLDLR